MTPVKIEPPTEELKPTTINMEILTPIKIEPPTEEPKPRTIKMEILTPIKDDSLGEKTEQAAGGCVCRYRGCCSGYV